jgi:arsenate reductase (thioredoxin)
VAREAPEVLFVCVHNAGRSQMAAALLERKAEGQVRVISAGSEPADRLNPAVVEAMSEIGIDISAERPKRLEDGMVRESDVVITMGCGDACPFYPGKRYEDWELEDPAGKDLETVRRIRDEIAGRVDALVGDLSGDAGGARSPRPASRPPPRPQ